MVASGRAGVEAREQLDGPEAAARCDFTRETGFEMPGWLTPLAVAVSASGILLAWLTYERRVESADALAGLFGPIRRAALANFWIDDVFLALYRFAMLGFARLIGWLDRYLVDGVLNVVSAWTVSAGDGLRRIQTGRIQDYVYGVAVGVIALVFWFRWLL